MYALCVCLLSEQHLCESVQMLTFSSAGIVSIVSSRCLCDAYFETSAVKSEPVLYILNRWNTNPVQNGQ